MLSIADVLKEKADLNAGELLGIIKQKAEKVAPGDFMFFYDIQDSPQRIRLYHAFVVNPDVWAYKFSLISKDEIGDVLYDDYALQVMDEVLPYVIARKAYEILADDYQQRFPGQYNTTIQTGMRAFRDKYSPAALALAKLRQNLKLEEAEILY